LKKILTIISTPIFAAAILFLSYIYSGNNLNEEAVIEIQPGASFNSVLNILASKEVIGNKNFFKIYAMIRGDLKNIKPGEYKFNSSSGKKNILDSITKGNVVLYKVTIPEGTNMYQIGDLLFTELGINKTEFLKITADREIIDQWKIDGDTLEGYLYPETYFFAKGTSAKKAAMKMVETFFAHYSDEITEKGKKMGLSQKEIIILASIIEKETGQAHERRLISSVFHNRLKRGMKLQSDPTTIYGFFERYRGNISKKDLLEYTPYNTYRIKGMPVGPIANPGMASIEAAVDPETSSYLYFVAKKDKTHVFSKTLVEHNAYVQEYQINRR
jgi:UPF0755 protein